MNDNDIYNQLKSSLRTTNITNLKEISSVDIIDDNLSVISKIHSTFFLNFYWQHSRCFRFQQLKYIKYVYTYKLKCINMYIDILGLCTFFASYQKPFSRYNVFKNKNDEIVIIDSLETHLIECYLFALINEISTFRLIDIYTFKEQTFVVPNYIKILKNEQDKVNVNSDLLSLTHPLVDTSYCKYCCYNCK